jgi:hypothetical protein
MSTSLIPYKFGTNISDYYNSIPQISYEISKCGNKLKQKIIHKSVQEEQQLEEKISELSISSESQVNVGSSSLEPDLNLDLVVTGGGVLGIYFALPSVHIVNKSNIKFKRLSGVSVGSMFIAIIRCGIKEETINQYLEEYHQLRRTWIDKKEVGPRKGNGISINDDVACILREILPPNAYELCSGSVFITMTELTLTGPKTVTISEYTDNEDLINAVVASCSIPFITICGPYTLFRGRKMVDGVTPYHFEDELRPCLVFNLAYVPYPLKKLVSMSDKKICKLIYAGLKHFVDWTENKEDSSRFYLQRRTIPNSIHNVLTLIYWTDSIIIERLPIIGSIKKKIIHKILS